MNRKRKMTILLLCVLILASTFIQSLAADSQKPNDKRYFSMENNTEVIIEEGVLHIPQEYVDQIAKENPNTLITISEYVKAVPEISPRFVIATVITKKTITKPKYVYADYFVASVAKGSTFTLKVEWSKTLSFSVTHSDAKTPLQLNDSITKKYSVGATFTGPPENSSYNSRSYRVRFFAEDGTYEGYRVHDTGQTLNISGTFRNPIEYSAYTIDSKVN